MSLSKEILAGMNLEEKIGQMFFVRPESLEAGNTILSPPTITDEEINNHERNMSSTSISDTQIASLKKYNVGGIAFFGKNILTREELIRYIRDLQDNSKYSLFIGVDEEGGLVQRLGRKAGVRLQPNMRTIGDTKKTENAYDVGNYLGKELSEIGFNINFAPVADIHTNPENKVIGNRAFGSEAIEVSKMVEATVRGFLEANIAATLKHFPGHGDTNDDSHLGTASSNIDMNTLMNREIQPFKTGIDAGADFVLTAHISLPNILSSYIPATMSKEIVTGILRDVLNFKKIIITDSLEMRAILNYYKTDEIITKCILAGIDVLLMPKNLEEYFYRLKQLVIEEVISEERINDSAKRIIDVKVERGIIR